MVYISHLEKPKTENFQLGLFDLPFCFLSPFLSKSEKKLVFFILFFFQTTLSRRKDHC